LGAYDYILKPIDLDYFQELLIKIIREQEQRCKKENEFKALRTRVAANLPLIRTQFIKDLISDGIEPDIIPLKLSELEMTRCSWCQVLLFQLDDFYLITRDLTKEQCRKLESSFNKLFQALDPDTETVVFENQPHEQVMVVWAGTEEALVSKVKTWRHLVREAVRDLGQYTVTTAIGTPRDCLDKLADSYQEAMSYMQFKFIIGKNREINRQDILEQKGRQEYKAGDLNETELLEAVQLGDKQLVSEGVKTLFQRMLAMGNNSAAAVQMMVSVTYLQALKLLGEIGASAEQVFNDPLLVYKGIMAHQTISGMQQELENRLMSVADFISQRKNKRLTQIVNKAKQYIGKNYAKDDLSLEEVAAYVKISPCYFSFTFKQEEGINFIDYLTMIRIEKAKTFLTASAYKSYEVSYLVGYNNPTYFSTIFKKCVGLSPSAYRTRYLQKPADGG
ncbi:MAG TPA: helix-turn-helix domain-containing protein, partial [Bacillota bacterium]